MLQGKRGRPARAKSAKTKAWQKLGFVYSDNYNISSSESEGNKDDDYDPMVHRLISHKNIRKQMFVSAP